MNLPLNVFTCLLLLLGATTSANADEGTYILSPKTGTVGTGEELQLQLRKVMPGVAQSAALTASEQKNFHWMLNAVGAGAETQWGTLIPGLVAGVYTYKAPNTVPARNPVAVSVSFADAKGSKIILVCNIRITTCRLSFQENNNDVVCLDKPGGSQAVTGTTGTGAYVSAKASTLISVQAVGKDMNIYSINAMFGGKGKGTYHWDLKACPCKNSGEVNGKAKNTSQISIGPPGGQANNYIIFTCRLCDDADRCTIVPMEGIINIHEYGPPGGKIKGAIVGQFIKNPPNNHAVEVIFRFEVTRLPDINN